jgi:hypothetical protein
MTVTTKDARTPLLLVSLLAGLVSVGATTPAMSGEFAFSASSAAVHAWGDSEMFDGPGPFEILTSFGDWTYAQVRCSPRRIDVVSTENGEGGNTLAELTSTFTVTSDADVAVDWTFYNNSPWCCHWGGALTIVDLTNDVVVFATDCGGYSCSGVQRLQLSAANVYRVSTTAWHAYVAIRACFADVTNNGVVDMNDLNFLLNRWGTRHADLNGDGTTDALDFLEVLGAWGECG